MAYYLIALVVSNLGVTSIMQSIAFKSYEKCEITREALKEHNPTIQFVCFHQKHT